MSLAKSNAELLWASGVLGILIGIAWLGFHFALGLVVDRTVRYPQIISVQMNVPSTIQPFCTTVSKKALSAFGQSMSCSDLDRDLGMGQIEHWLSEAWLSRQIQEKQLSNDEISLEYIDFFAESSTPNRFAKFRLLQKEGWLRLTPAMIEEEIVYLYPDLPFTIQSKNAELTLHNKQEVQDWKTEVLEQEWLGIRLQQYARYHWVQEGVSLMTLLSETPTLQVYFAEHTWKGWVTISFRLEVEGCRTIEDRHMRYLDSVSEITLPIPYWMWDDRECLEQFQNALTRSLTKMSVFWTPQDEWTERYRAPFNLEKCHGVPAEWTTECFITQ